MSKALYRKYRPTQLSDVIGQTQVTAALEKSLEQGKISHAYLFIGPRGTGKTSVARIFAHAVNKFDYQVEDDYVDIIEIDGASNRGIDNIRELREKAAIAPTSGKYKIYIIDEVHMLTKEAFNALLKTLEEPPSHIIFIMATTEANKVPVTITSRAQLYTFKLAEPKIMFDYLKNITKKEKINIDDDALEIIVKRGGGSFRDSISLLDQISTLSQDKLTKDLVISAMGLPEDEKITTLLDEYLSGDVVKITTLIKDLLSSGVKAETIAEEIINNILSNPKPELFPLLEKLPDVKAPFAEARLLVALSDKMRVTPVSGERAFRSATARELAREPRGDGGEQRDPKTDTGGRTRIHSFNQQDFLSSAKKANDAIYLQLKKSEFELNNNILNIYPGSKISETILNAKNNKSLLNELSDGFTIKIHKYGEKPKNNQNNQILDKISDIMGGEVKNDGGENPF